jgi:mitogen-activated protein kinase kinase kinase 2
MKKEVSLLKHLNHSNIVRYYQTDMSEDMKSIDVLLEFVPGGSLRVILEKYGALELDVIRNYGKQLIKGLNYLHCNKIVHRDLKSANILIASDGVLKVSDFGSSRKFEEQDGFLCKSLRGSPYWMAPEVVKREGYTFSADIWSFGCVLIEMATGRPPWSNYSNETQKVLQLILKDESYPDIPKRNSALARIIQRCLNRNQALRPSTSDLMEMEFFDLEQEIL